MAAQPVFLTLLFLGVPLVLGGCAASPAEASPPADEGEPRPGAAPAAPESEGPTSAGPRSQGLQPGEPQPPTGSPGSPDSLQKALDLLDSGQEARGIAALRQELAEGPRALDAALALAAYMASAERLPEALASVDAGLMQYDDHPALLLARAELLRDLGQREDALAALRKRQQRGPSHPRLWVEIAELAWLIGDREAALDALARLREEHEDHPWVNQQLPAIRDLEQEMRNNPSAQTISRRDLLGTLRGAPQSMARFQALRVLVSEGGDLQKKAAAIAWNDREPALRVQALRLGDWTAAQAEMLSRAALVDEAASVRAAALPLTRRVDPRIAAPMILQALELETDPTSFRLMHEALLEIRNARIFLPPGAAETEAGRAAVVAEWKAEWRGL